jgi:hypothetical protein
LAVEDTPEKLVLKTVDGQRSSIEPRLIEDRRMSDVSLMPEGLAQSMTTQEVVDLIAYLSSLHQPVSIIGEYQVVGPLHEPNGTRLIDPASVPALRVPIPDGRGHQLSWRQLSANVEGQIDLSLFAAPDSDSAAYMAIPVTSPISQASRLVIDTPLEVQAWLDGKLLTLTALKQNPGAPKAALVDLPKGTSRLLLRAVTGARSQAHPSLVATFVSDQPIGFDSGTGTSSSGESSRR